MRKGVGGERGVINSYFSSDLSLGFFMLLDSLNV
jgi:hypothetical protein